MPWSAQWMSSNTSTSGLRRAIASTHGADRREEALAHALRVLALERARRSAGASMPSSRPISAARRSVGSPTRRRQSSRQVGDRGRAASPRPRRRRRRRRSRPRRGSPRRAPSRRFPSRRAGSGPRGRWARRLALAEQRARTPARRRDLPTPACPITVTRCALALARRRGRRAARAARACRRGRPAAISLRERAQARRRQQALRLPGRHRLGLALQRQRLERLVARPRGASRAWCARRPSRCPAARPTGAATATLTVSPITV